MSDGGHVCLDWFDESCEEDGGGNQGGPIVLILCGMTGQFYSSIYTFLEWNLW